ncbi:hypothetical protein [Salinisphaera hydrothermalis]|uniref:hypothetical protein n=1 Tax=Salinisphaera hydrothermalis TaxID=563188 RepID=UPI003342B4AD
MEAEAADRNSTANSADSYRKANGQFAKGNPGKPKGTRNRATRACENVIRGHARELTDKAVELALAGDPQALRMCLDRLVPVVRERPAEVDLPAINTARDVPKALAAILENAADGTLTPTEARTLAAVVGETGKAIEVAELEERLAAIEATLAAKSRGSA